CTGNRTTAVGERQAGWNDECATGRYRDRSRGSERPAQRDVGTYIECSLIVDDSVDDPLTSAVGEHADRATCRVRERARGHPQGGDSSAILARELDRPIVGEWLRE